MGGQVVHEAAKTIKWVPPPQLDQILHESILIDRFLEDLGVFDAILE